LSLSPEHQKAANITGDQNIVRLLTSVFVITVGHLFHTTHRLPVVGTTKRPPRFQQSESGKVHRPEENVDRLASRHNFRGSVLQLVERFVYVTWRFFGEWITALWLYCDAIFLGTIIGQSLLAGIEQRSGITLQVIPW